MKNLTLYGILSVLIIMSGKAVAKDDVNAYREEHVSYSYETLPNGTVRFSILNGESLEITGDLIRERVRYPANGEILTPFSVPSSGSFKYIDDTILPGEPYVYIFEYTMPGLGEYIMHFDTVTASANIPALGHFVLLAPTGDDEYDVLRDGYQITIRNTNIKVEANALTKSVVFNLNGHKIKDNAAPFTVFPEGNCGPGGRLRNGSYTLMAIAYPAKNGKGIPGDTLKVSFTVLNTYEVAAVHVFPNPVRDRLNISVKGPADSPVRFLLQNDRGESCMAIPPGMLDFEGRLMVSTEIAGIRRGVYFLSVAVGEEVIHTRVLIE